MEIAAMSELYNVGIKVWEINPSGELASPFDTTLLAVSKGLGTLHLSRHRGVHYNSVIPQNRKSPLLLGVSKTASTDMLDARLSSFEHSSTNGMLSNSLILLPKRKELDIRNIKAVSTTSEGLAPAD